MLPVRSRYLAAYLLLFLTMTLLACGCQPEDPTLTAAPPPAANAVPAQTAVNKDRGEAASADTTVTRGGAGPTKEQ